MRFPPFFGAGFRRGDVEVYKQGEKEDAANVIFDSIRSAVDFASHLPRYREIVQVLFKYGFANELRLAALEHLLGIEQEARPPGKDDILSKPLPVRIRLALEELGPTFVKFGQIVSSRRDVVTDEYYQELIKLQSNVPPFPGKEAVKIIESELKSEVGEIYATFDPEPLAGASIAQVHRATMHDGTRVAVKVQRPAIEERITMDLVIAADIARFSDKHVPEVSGLNPIGVVHEFSISLMKELDFNNEASNAERFAEQFDSNSHIRVPKIFREATTSRVLTMEFLEGCRPDELAILQANEIDAAQLSEHITDLIYKQVFEFGFFHADPHPGNMVISKDGVVGLFDYGMMGTFTPEFRLSVAHMISGLAEKNHRSVMRSILEMSEEGYARDPQKMLLEVEEFSDEHLNRPLKEINLGFVLNKLLELLRNNRLRMKGSFYLGIKALSQVESIGRTLNPDLNFVEMGRPYATQVIVGKYSPQRIFRLGRRILSDAVDFLEEFPHDFRTLYQRVKRGDVSLPLEHKIDPQGFEPLRKTLDSIANRLTNAILSASVLICSGILVLANLPPHVFGVSLFGFIGLLFGAFMCLRLVLSIWKHGGL